MKIWVGVTDNNWFDFLSKRQTDEVNFWQPGAKAPFVSLPPGTPFLFKLKRPYNHIAGGGFFVKFVTLPFQLAWEAFGETNGAASANQLEKLLRPLLPDPNVTSFDIGCTILTNPFFFPKNHWIEVSKIWAPNIVRGKTYQTQDSEGSPLWQEIENRLSAQKNPLHVSEQPARYGIPFLTQARLGQGTFRVLVTEAYGRRCTITGESTLPVLEAAHIKPVSQNGPNNTFNGLLLRSDFHKLFDLGFVTITPDLSVEVSSRIKESWFNGKPYYRLHGKKIAVIPDNTEDQPRQELLRWHNDNVFV